MKREHVLIARVRADFADLEQSPTCAGMQLAAVAAAEQVIALAGAAEYGRNLTQALAELREWYRLAAETRGGNTPGRDPLLDLLESIPLTGPAES